MNKVKAALAEFCALRVLLFSEFFLGMNNAAWWQRWRRVVWPQQWHTKFRGCWRKAARTSSMPGSACGWTVSSRWTRSTCSTIQSYGSRLSWTTARRWTWWATSSNLSSRRRGFVSPSKRNVPTSHSVCSLKVTLFCRCNRWLQYETGRQTDRRAAFVSGLGRGRARENFPVIYFFRLALTY